MSEEINKRKYKATIGLEIHAELKTETKMFSSAKNNPDEVRPNANVHPIDLAHPGTLPTINKKAVEHVIRVGTALGGEIANFTEFDRKNYFYPDIPKGYQISQYAFPIVSGGSLNGIDITRIHLEEDTGLSKHDRGDFSLVDFNRAGVPLMELVTEPVIHSAKDAVEFAKQFQILLRYLGAGDANMEKGEMRIEANISISDTDKFGTKVEVKNLNSFRVVEKAIQYEIERMTELMESGRGDEIVQETRGWDENVGRTFSQRKKETSDDYRYFPEPDLPKMNLHEVFDLEKIKTDLPELPWERKERLIRDFGIAEMAADIFVVNEEFSKFFDKVVEGKNSEKDFIKTAANYITSDLVALMKDGASFPDVDNFKKLIEMILKNEISSRGAKDILAVMVVEGGDPEKIADEKGLKQQSDAGALEAIVDQIISENSAVFEEFKAGKDASLQFLIGQGMKISKGSANPQMLRELFLSKIK
ncbi:MAG: Asp-tRNA(Asn)/Glu-tRNA(Gln) amidotransferase subunit GatB [Candidatus Paceibacterota bacterium]